MFALFAFVEAANFRDSCKFSDCVQDVWEKKMHKNFFMAREDLGTRLGRKCYAIQVAGRVRDDNRRQLRRQI